jgi:hypothetical protein
MERLLPVLTACSDAIGGAGRLLPGARPVRVRASTIASFGQPTFKAELLGPFGNGIACTGGRGRAKMEDGTGSRPVLDIDKSTSVSYSHQLQLLPPTGYVLRMTYVCMMYA